MTSMTNKRIKHTKIVFKMPRSVAPVNVSPVIKAFRWTFLILGIFYGVNRLHNLRAYEDKAGPKRKQELLQQYNKIKEKGRIQTRDDLVEVSKDLEVTEFSPGWDKDL